MPSIEQLTIAERGRIIAKLQHRISVLRKRVAGYKGAMRASVELQFMADRKVSRAQREAESFKSQNELLLKSIHQTPIHGIILPDNQSLAERMQGLCHIVEDLRVRNRLHFQILARLALTARFVLLAIEGHVVGENGVKACTEMKDALADADRLLVNDIPNLRADMESRNREDIERASREKLVKLERALFRYAQHDQDCTYGQGTCTCGLSAIVNELPITSRV